MSDSREMRSVGPRIRELEKSTLPAGLADPQGAYPFYCSSPDVKRIARPLTDIPAVLMGTGGVASVHYANGPYAYSTDTWAFTSRDEQTDLRFLYRQFERLLPRIDYLGFGGSGLRHLNKHFIRQMVLPSPIPKVQSKIVQVLDTLDTAIAQTEAIIAKLKAVKQGLLHDLLTRGIDANGELRPPQSEAPKLYKQSAVGWIPKEWETRSIGELLADVTPAMRSGPFGSELLKHELVESGFPLLGIDNVFAEKFVSDYRRFVTRNKFNSLSRYAVRPNDLMITIMGTVGRCCLVPEGIGKALSSKHTWTITLDPEKYSAYLAMLQVNHSPWVLRHFAKDAQGGTMSAIRSDTLRSTLLPRPPRDEQEIFEARLRAVASRIEIEVEYVEKLVIQKRGLMDDLLTGRVRVTPLLETAAA